MPIKRATRKLSANVFNFRVADDPSKTRPGEGEVKALSALNKYVKTILNPSISLPLFDV